MQVMSIIKTGRLVYLLAVLLFWALVLQGCSGDERKEQVHAQTVADQAGVGLLEPCELISREEAATIAGVVFGEGIVSEQPAVGLKLCRYEEEGTDIGEMFQIGVTQSAAMPESVRAGGQSPRSIFLLTKEAFAENRKEIKDLGDDAFIATPGVHILHGDFYITIALGNIDKKADKLEAAGRLVVTNLEKRGR